MRKVLPTLGLLIFLAIDVALVSLAYLHAQGSAADVSPRPSQSEEADGSPVIQPIQGGPRPTPWAMSIANDGALIRATPGDCADGGRANVDVSLDKGASFMPIDLTLMEVTAVQAVSRDEIHVVGAGSDCAVVAYASSDEGRTWSSRSASNLWYADPNDTEQLHGPGGNLSPGCEIRQVHPVDAQLARVSCVDGLVVGTADGGATWVRLGQLEGAVVMVFTAPSNAVALAPVSGCGAQSFLTRDGGRSWESAGCIPVDGIEGLASNGAALVAQVGGEIFLSADNAESWTQH